MTKEEEVKMTDKCKLENGELKNGDSENGDDSTVSTSSSDENSERGNWDNPIEFLLSCIGYAVGLGNIWRFPYLCMRNGGGAFLLPYFTFLLLCGVPLFYLELVVGQFSSLSALKVFKICPIAKGVGWGMVIVSGLCSIYYNLIITWVLYYLGSSFTSELPWADCDHWWNTPNCTTKWITSNMTHFAANMTHNASATFLDAMHNVSELPLVGNVSHIHPTSPQEEFWDNKVLQRSSGIEETGGIRLELLGILAAAWMLVFGCLFKGIKSSGKVVYVTATFPYIFLTALLIRGAMLPGSLDGVKWYITPDFDRLLDLRTWCEACLQIFYSLGPAWGSLITMSSYNKFNHNALRDAMIIPIVNCGTSFFAGFVIFSIIGFMANDAGVNVDQVISSGPGLVFMAYPAALARMPFSVGWSIVFFVMLLSIGLGTQFCMVETVSSGMVDLNPNLLRRWKPVITGSFCVLGILIGLPFVTRAGVYHFQIWDWYSAAFSVTVMGCLECITFAWLYGWRRIYSDIEMMSGHRPSPIWRFLWCFVTPTLLFCVIMYSAINMASPYYGSYTFPSWAVGFGWVLAMCSIIPVPLMAIKEVYSRKGTLRQRILASCQPSEDWGPALLKDREHYKASVGAFDLAQAKAEEKKALALQNSV